MDNNALTLKIALKHASVRRVLFFSTLMALATGWLGGQLTRPVLGMEVTFHNVSTQMIESIQLDFGSAASQSRIQAFRLPPGESRTLALNHTPGMGFNVQILYRDGRKQEFCALRGDDRTQPELPLRP
ncbi:hypothetical protein H9C73_01290 [Marinobacterium sp. AK62]|uniref:Uncharacterized protein n=1 Tax=Marinobacterium alkalitolerans TaxID=1542925 RepID=A0ABS3Z6X9_9GAMM|nr:hypothetical protein [Marinobacterium alkalitolerans]MBP0047356.1 hypothetical protein [Marinobacterium alkalitolerans]